VKNHRHILLHDAGSMIQ